MKKLFYFYVFLLILFSINVIADGVGDAERAYVTNAASSLTILSAVDGTNLIGRGTTRATERALIFRTINSVRYAIGETNVSFRNQSNSTSNATIANLVQLLDLDLKTVIFDIKQVSRGSGILTMYILKNDSDNALVICEGATERGNARQGCASASEVTQEATIYPKGYTGSYTVSSYTDATTGLSYWKVYGMTGTGMQSISIDLGGGVVNKIASKENYVSLDEQSFKKYISNLNVEYYVMFQGKKYLFIINEIDPNNEYASLNVQDINKNINVKAGDSEEFDLNNDGELDVIFHVTKLEYPFIYAEISTYVSEKAIEFTSKEKDAEVQNERLSDYPGGIWSRFLKTVQTSKMTLYLLVLAVVIIAGVFGFIGTKVMKKIWKAT